MIKRDLHPIKKSPGSHQKRPMCYGFEAECFSSSSLFYRVSSMLYQKSLTVYINRILHPIKKSPTSCQKQPYMSSKDPNHIGVRRSALRLCSSNSSMIYQKEPFTLSMKPSILSKEPNVLPKRAPYLIKKGLYATGMRRSASARALCDIQMSPMFYSKSPVLHQKSPMSHRQGPTSYGVATVSRID